MFKAILIFALVIAAVLGGLLALRSSRQAGMPDEDVLKRAAEREREQAAKDKDQG
jgi:hypothetical protein